MNISAERAILAYMSTRCDVSSQHKLPVLEELYDTVTIGLLFSRETIDRTMVDLIARGKVFQYGPYLSDHVIDVM